VRNLHEKGAAPSAVSRLPEQAVGIDQKTAMSLGGALGAPRTAFQYPGSTYTLTYDPRRDQLEGVYFQAAMQQRFDVVFVRLKSSAGIR